MEITRKDEATSRTETQRYRGAQRIYSTNILWQILLLLLTITIASAGTKNTEPAASQPFPQRGYQIFPQGISSVQGTVKQFPSYPSVLAAAELWDENKKESQNQILLINSPLCKAGLSRRLCSPLCLCAKRGPTLHSHAILPGAAKRRHHEAPHLSRTS